ncbi:MAG: hypothetical protein AAFY15_15010, partial [Cyanobacteria bacterium J06648_11]
RLRRVRLHLRWFEDRVRSTSMVVGLRTPDLSLDVYEDNPVVKACAMEPARGYGEFARFSDCGQSLEDAIVHPNQTSIEIMAAPSYWLLRLSECEVLSVSAASPRCFFYARSAFNHLQRTECYVRGHEIRSIDGDFCLKKLGDVDANAYTMLREGRHEELLD